MELHNLRVPTKKRGIKRIGRGGKRGTYSGRGQKGQRARSGHRIRPASRDLLARLPKLRGVKNKSLKLKPLVLNVGDLEKKLETGLLITKQILLEKKIIKGLDHRIKILGKGDLKKSLNFEGLSVSKNARLKIEKAGGSVK
jgi:large subunit ribosomal protein L15